MPAFSPRVPQELKNAEARLRGSLPGNAEHVVDDYRRELARYVWDLVPKMVALGTGLPTSWSAVHAELEAVLPNPRSR